MKILTPSFLALACFVLGGLMFKSMAPTQCGPILSNDSMFVLTGDARRIPFAIRQMHNHPDSKLYIIGAGGGSSYDASHKVTIESESKSTYQNAIAIREITEHIGLNRIVLITTEDHMNRALYLTRQTLPDMEIVPCPVRLTGMPATKRLERWTTEYIKYIVTMFGIKEG